MKTIILKELMASFNLNSLILKSEKFQTTTPAPKKNTLVIGRQAVIEAMQTR